MNLDDLSLKIKLRANALPGEVDKVVKRAALECDQTLVLATPVDTGRARSNWRVSVDAPIVDTIGPYAPGEKLGIGEAANARAALDHGKAVIVTRKPGQKIYISNNLPYISRLNEGYSAQAPAMFVQSAISAAVQAVRGAIIDTGNPGKGGVDG